MTSQTVVAMFPSRSLLTKALDHITHLTDIEVQRAAIIAKAASGRTIVIDDGITADEAGVAGGLLGAVLMLLGAVQFGTLDLPAAAAAALLLFSVLSGGLLGAIVGRLAQRLFASRSLVRTARVQIEAFAAQVEAGSLALVLQVKDDLNVLLRLHDELQRYKVQFAGEANGSAPILERTA